MKKPLLLLCLLCSLVANAQIFAPPGAEWYYKYTPYGGSGINAIERYTYEGDTIINTINCQRIMGHDYNGNIAPYLKYFFYSDTDHIFFYNPTYHVFDKIFDYTLNFGDSTLLHRIYQTDDSTYYTRVIDKGIDIINGLSYRWVYYYTPNTPGNIYHSFNGKYYEKLGFLDGHFTYEDEYGISLDAKNIYCLNKYRDAVDTAYYIHYGCNVPLAVQENTISDFSIYPNPSSGVFQIQSKQPVKFIEVVDMLGKTLLSMPLNGSEVNLSELPQGIYAVKVVFVNGAQGMKKLIIN